MIVHINKNNSIFYLFYSYSEKNGENLDYFKSICIFTLHLHTDLTFWKYNKYLIKIMVALFNFF